MKVNPIVNLFPIGTIAPLLDMSVDEAEKFIEALEIQPIFALNHVPYFSMAQFIVMQGTLDDRRAQQQQAKVAASN
jgi:hypothetical protein